MGNLFSIDSPLMRGMSKIADIMILNLLVIVTCIPIITIGASMSAMHYVLIKLSRNEGTSVLQMYFKSFKENLFQATALWLVNVIALVFFAYDMYVFFFAEIFLPMPVFICVVAVGVLFMMTCMYFYPLQARFINPVSRTIKNSFFVMVLNFPKSVGTIILYAIPVAMIYLGIMGADFLFPLVFLFGIAAPGYGAALLYKDVFKKLEPKEEEITDDMDFHVLADEDTSGDEEVSAAEKEPEEVNSQDPQNENL